MTLFWWGAVLVALYGLGEAIMWWTARPKRADPEKIKRAAHEMEYSVMVAVEKAQDEAAIRYLLAEVGLTREVGE